MWLERSGEKEGFNAECAEIAEKVPGCVQFFSACSALKFFALEGGIAVQ